MLPLLLKYRRIFAFGFFAVIAGGGCFYVFRHLAAWLIVSDPLPPSLDIVLTLSGQDSRLTYTKKLFPRYSHAVWLLSYPNRTPLRLFVKECLDTSRILIVDTCANTQSEIAFLKTWLAACSPKRFSSLKHSIGAINIGIVSDWYHMRRIKLIVDTQIEKRRFLFYYIPVPLEDDIYRNSYTKWWQLEKVRPVVYREWIKIIYYGINHFPDVFR